MSSWGLWGLGDRTAARDIPGLEITDEGDLIRATIHGEPAGWMEISRTDDDEPFVGNIEVEPQHRRKGVGTAMWEFAGRPPHDLPEYQTDAGKAWAKSTPAPSRKRQPWDVSVNDHTASTDGIRYAHVVEADVAEDLHRLAGFKTASHEHVPSGQRGRPDWTGCAHPECRPDLPTTMYHVSHPRNRDSIAQHGLLTSYSEDDEFSDELGMPHGIYMTADEPKTSHDTERWPGDVWAVDTTKLKHLENDFPGGMLFRNAYATKYDVPPEAIRLHRPSAHHTARLAMPSRDAYDYMVMDKKRKTDNIPEQGEFYHGSNHEHQPGDILESVRARGDSDRLDYYERSVGAPNHADWVWMYNHPAPATKYHKNVYQLEPLDEGPWIWNNIRRDDGQFRPTENDEDFPRLVSPRARVIRKLTPEEHAAAGQHLSDFYEKLRTDSQRLAMPAPMPEGITFHHHPTNDTVPTEPWAHDPTVLVPQFSAPAVEARHNGKTVGFLEWDPPLHNTTVNGISYGDHPPEVSMIRVDPDYRRHGIGTALFDFARSHQGDLEHSDSRTDLGRKWVDYEQSRTTRLAMPAITRLHRGIGFGKGDLPADLERRIDSVLSGEHDPTLSEVLQRHLDRDGLGKGQYWALDPVAADLFGRQVRFRDQSDFQVMLSGDWDETGHVQSDDVSPRYRKLQPGSSPVNVNSVKVRRTPSGSWMHPNDEGWINLHPASHTAARTAMPAVDAYDSHTPPENRRSFQEIESGPWYHSSDHEFQPGDMVIPGGGPSVWSDSGFYEFGKENRPDWVWMDKNPADSNYWGYKYRYEVKPEGEGPWAWNWHPSQKNPSKWNPGYVSPRAKIVRRISKRQQMQRAYAHRTAMPQPLPKGVYFRYHPELVWSPGVTAHAPGGKQVGSLEWYDDDHVMVDLAGRRPGEIDQIAVHPDHQGQSIATSMFDFAKQHEPRLHHSDRLTEDGRGWSAYEKSRHARLAMPAPLPQGVTFTPFGPGDDLHRQVAEKHNMDAYAEVWDRMSGVVAHLNGDPVGHLVWFHPGVTDIGRGGKTVDVGNEVGSIGVRDDLQHHSVATGMWDYARSLNPGLRHSPVKTQDGRGWADYEQSRHARLASSNWPDPSREPIPADPQYVYHGTHDYNAQDIADYGHLDVHDPDYGTDQDTWPDGSVEPRSYWTHDPQVARNFYPEGGRPALLRSPRSSGDFRQERHSGDLYSTSPISADHLEVYSGPGQWTPLTQYREQRNARLAMAWDEWAPQVQGGCGHGCDHSRMTMGEYSIQHPYGRSALQFTHDTAPDGTPELYISGVHTNEGHRRSGVAEALLRRLHDDHPGTRINPGYMTDMGQGLKDGLVGRMPGVKDVLAGKNGDPPPMTFEPFNTMWSNGIMARHAEDGRPLAHLHWYPDGEIESIRVHPELQGRDIGKHILAHAVTHPEIYEAEGGIKPSNHMTDAGRAYAKSLGYNPPDEEITHADNDVNQWGWTAVRDYVPMSVPYTGQNEDEMSKHLEDEWTPPTQKTAATNDGWPVWWRGRHRPGVEFDKRWHPNHPEHVPAPWESSL